MATPVQTDRAHVSDRRSVPLRQYAALPLTTQYFTPACAWVQVRQGFIDARPEIGLVRWAKQAGADRGGLTPGSEYTFSIEEAAELARVLLDAVDLAMGLGQPDLSDPAATPAP